MSGAVVAAHCEVRARIIIMGLCMAKLENVQRAFSRAFRQAGTLAGGE